MYFRKTIRKACLKNIQMIPFIHLEVHCNFIEFAIHCQCFQKHLFRKQANATTKSNEMFEAVTLQSSYK